MIMIIQSCSLYLVTWMWLDRGNGGGNGLDDIKTLEVELNFKVGVSTDT